MGHGQGRWGERQTDTETDNRHPLPSQLSVWSTALRLLEGRLGGFRGGFRGAFGGFGGLWGRTTARNGEEEVRTSDTCRL